MLSGTRAPHRFSFLLIVVDNCCVFANNVYCSLCLSVSCSRAQSTSTSFRPPSFCRAMPIAFWVSELSFDCFLNVDMCRLNCVCYMIYMCNNIDLSLPLSLSLSLFLSLSLPLPPLLSLLSPPSLPPNTTSLFSFPSPLPPLPQRPTSLSLATYRRHRGTWIVKPTTLSRGRGISLVNHVRYSIPCLVPAFQCLMQKTLKSWDRAWGQGYSIPTPI